MPKEPKSKTKLCPYKKITEKESNSFKGKTTINERFAPCAGDRCVAYRPGGKCARLEESE